MPREGLVSILRSIIHHNIISTPRSGLDQASVNSLPSSGYCFIRLRVISCETARRFVASHSIMRPHVALRIIAPCLVTFPASCVIVQHRAALSVLLRPRLLWCTITRHATSHSIVQRCILFCRIGQDCATSQDLNRCGTASRGNASDRSLSHCTAYHRAAWYTRICATSRCTVQYRVASCSIMLCCDILCGTVRPRP
jgi:hypothetical protein